MKAQEVFFPEANAIALRTIDLPQPQPGEVLLEAYATALSPGTERSILTGESGRPYPVAIGYSFAGKVLAAPAGSRFEVGQPVVTHGPHASAMIADERFVTPAPETVPFDQASFFNLAHTALYGVRRARLSFGEPVVVLGLGPVGLLAAKFCQMHGAAPVVVVDTASERLEIARRFGLPFAVNANDSDALQALLADMEGGGPAVVIEATGSERQTARALDLVRTQGRIVLLATYRGADTITFHRQMSLKGAEFIGAWVNSKPYSLEQTNVSLKHWPPLLDEGSRRYWGPGVWSSDEDIRLILRLMSLGQLDVTPLITHRFSPEQAADAYRLVLDRSPGLVGGVIGWR